MARQENGIDRFRKDHSKINQVYERFQGNSCLIQIRDALNPRDNVMLKLTHKSTIKSTKANNFLFYYWLTISQSNIYCNCEAAFAKLK